MMATNAGRGQSLGSGTEESEPLLQPVRGATNTLHPGKTSSNLGVNGVTDNDAQETLLTKRQLWSLYLSHFLSTWNARGYEFAAIIFTASAYPETLTASSIRGILTAIAALALSSSVGRWCDKRPSRLEALRTTIFVQRTCIVLACLGWFVIVREDFLGGGFFATVRDQRSKATNGADILDGNPWGRATVMAGVMFLGIGERLSAVGNMMVMERDWVPTLVDSTSKPSLPELNAVMRRIDLLCKLIAPVFVSIIAIWAASIRVTIFIIASMNLVSVVVEWFSAKKVWMECEKLQAPRVIAESGEYEPEQTSLSRIETRLGRWSRGLRLFFRSEIWIPSLALALLYFSVLSFSASMITYLLNSGFTLSVITIARTGSTFIEVSSTVIMPWGVKVMDKTAARKIIRARLPADSVLKPAAAIERTGLWGLWWMVVNLIPVTTILFYLPIASESIVHPTPFLTISLFIFLALSRLGLWTYDLVAQTLVQTRISTGNRGEFSGVEIGFISAAELLQWIATAIWSSPEQFKFVAATGNACVVVSALAYTAWMWRRRGHLLHWEKVVACVGCK